MAVVCDHLDQIQVIYTDQTGCEECLKLGDTWMHLRLCLSCGSVGCCDDSKNQHASKHAAATEHPIVGSLEPGEAWQWCYVDEAIV